MEGEQGLECHVVMRAYGDLAKDEEGEVICDEATYNRTEVQGGDLAPFLSLSHPASSVPMASALATPVKVDYECCELTQTPPPPWLSAVFFTVEEADMAARRIFAEDVLQQEDIDDEDLEDATADYEGATDDSEGQVGLLLEKIDDNGETDLELDVPANKVWVERSAVHGEPPGFMRIDMGDVDIEVDDQEGEEPDDYDDEEEPAADDDEDDGEEPVEAEEEEQEEDDEEEPEEEDDEEDDGEETQIAGAKRPRDDDDDDDDGDADADGDGEDEEEEG